jgi:protein-tyrosine-phosphatase
MKKTVLFVCVENAGRSQMAEGFFRKYAPAGYSAVSAGTRPAGQVNPVAMEAMMEVGIDIGMQKSKIITDEMIRESVKAVNMGCMDSAECPVLFLNNPMDLGIEDPKGKKHRKGPHHPRRDREKSNRACQGPRAE